MSRFTVTVALPRIEVSRVEFSGVGANNGVTITSTFILEGGKLDGRSGPAKRAARRALASL